MQVVVGHVFEDSGAEAASYDAVLHGDDAAEVLSHFPENVLIDGFEETYVVMGYIDAFSPEFFHHALHDIPERTYAEHSHVVPVGELSATAYGPFLERALPIDEYASASRVADDERTLVGELGSEHEASQLMLVHGRGTGALRKAVHEVLRTFPGVASYNLAPEDQGGDGMTQVLFR
jgi:hypothetical protein